MDPLPEPAPVDLQPAKWIWLPSQRSLPNTFVFFRKTFDLQEVPAQGRLLLTADSRYRLYVNGSELQFGPAPGDPREWDVDALDIATYLRSGENVIGAHVLYYGHSEGTWVAGKPGLIARLELLDTVGHTTLIATDQSWRCGLDRSVTPGRSKRSYLQALQEVRDLRHWPSGWNQAGFTEDSLWTDALELRASSAQPAIYSRYPDRLNDASADPRAGSLRPSLRLRQIPFMREELRPAVFHSATSVQWHRPPEDWFDFRMPECLSFSQLESYQKTGDNSIEWNSSSPSEAAAFIFNLPEQMVGFPQVEIEAPEGTIVEIILQEAHDPSNPPWLDTGHFAWSRFVCRQGRQTLRPFDYDTARWIQVHIRQASGPVAIRSVSFLRRSFDFAQQPQISVSQPSLQKLIDASINTLRNNVLETLVDCVGRERQQYSGDIGHCSHATRRLFGEYRQPRRFLRTYSSGQTLQGYLLDNWPAHDRLVRIPQRLLGFTQWGPILDHSIGFLFDAYHHYLESGDRDGISEVYPRLTRLFEYFAYEAAKRDELLPVSDLGVPFVWIDHDAYLEQEHKRCAYNLYLAAALEHALPPLAAAFDDETTRIQASQLGSRIRQRVVESYWDTQRKTFVVNLPQVRRKGEPPRFCDRSLATALLYGACPDGHVEESLRLLATRPANLGYSYPPNQIWRHWALARHGKLDTLLHEYESEWATMAAVVQNNTMPEHWKHRPDSPDQFSHAAVAPLLALLMEASGIRPLQPGFATTEIQPQLGSLQGLELAVHTPHGPIRFSDTGTGPQSRELRLDLPPGITATLKLPHQTVPNLQGHHHQSYSA